VGTSSPDSIFHVVGGLKFVTGRQQAGYVLTSDAGGGADWKPASATDTSLLLHKIDSINNITGYTTKYQNSLKQNILSGTGYAKWSGTTPSYLTPTQVTADLNLFTTSLQGLTPGGGTANKVLHGDGTWKDTTAAGTAWSLTGNTLLNRTTNYIGSTDTSQVHIDTKGIPAITIDSLQRVGVGTKKPLAVFHSNTMDGTGLAFLMTGNPADGTTGDTTKGAGFILEHNATGNRQFWIGDYTSGLGIRFLEDGTNGVMNGYNNTSQSSIPLLFNSDANPVLISTGGLVSIGIVNGGTGYAQTANSTLQTLSFATAYVAKTATYTAGASDYTINFTSGVDTCTLPTAVGITGRIYTIVNSGTSVFIKTTSSQTFANVSGTPTTLLKAAVGTIVLQSNGANWLEISSLGMELIVLLSLLPTILFRRKYFYNSMKINKTNIKCL
jgi:hypothetical protein